jgi:MYXO-CTERM domain-containing protein
MENAMPRLPLAVLPALLALCLGAPAHAIVLSGSFSGIASAEPLPLNFPPPRPVSDYDGAPITGTFEVNVPDPQFYQGDGSGTSGYFLNGGGGYLSMSFRILGEQFDVFQGSPPAGSFDFPSIIDLQTGPTGQSVRFMTDFRPRYSGGILTLSGAAGSLFAGLDPSTLHIDPAAPPALSAYFADAGAEMSISVAATSVSFQLASPVPEAPGLWMGLAGLGLIGAARRRT